MEEILLLFPNLTERQREQLNALGDLYSSWNSKVNVVSRKDIEALYSHHVLHSLSIAKVIEFNPATRILDVGTGGGFPGIPLAILFPSCSFTLVDSIGKKVMVVQSVAQELGLENVTPLKSRVEELTDSFHFAVTRAVAPIPNLCNWLRGRIVPGGSNSLANGLIALKGGDLSHELASYRKRATVWSIPEFFSNSYFEEKKVVHIPFY